MSASQSILIDHWGLPTGARPAIQRIPTIEVGIKVPLFRKTNCRVFWTIRGRLIIYDDGSKVLRKSNSQHSQFLIAATSSERWLELGKLCYLSSYGLYFELQGKMRLHSAVIQKFAKVNCYWGLPDSGKTTLAKKFLDSSKRNVLTDELCFFDGEYINAIPLKLHDKDQRCLIPVREPNLERFPLSAFFLLSKSRDGKLHYSSVNIKTQIRTFFILVLGLGIHQMAEYHLTMINIPSWFKILVLRIRLSWILCRKYPWKQISLTHQKL